MIQIEKLKKIREFSRKLHKNKDPAHDFSHVERVAKLCENLAISKKCNMNLLLISAYFHGVLNREVEIRKFLNSLGYSRELIEKVITTVKNSTLKTKTVEEKILHDSNLLDALGAVGIARSFTKGGCENQTLSETLKILKENMKRKMLTSKAKALANERRKFIEKFIKELEEELETSEY